ncbi:cell wall hydrolase [Streptomyces sp. VTCC 41912]|uniref:cell wall hydrolase n=1 Tax=Streptomyces sp. VTCC 41912 TaxID=3383243 RepID=UPI00389696FE
MASPDRPQVPTAHGSVAFEGLPRALRNVAYSAARHPGAGTPECPSHPAGPPAAGPAPPPDLTGGADCQRYAYAVLGHFGLRVPPPRSAELWADRAATRPAAPPGPLDPVLFDAGPVPARPAGYGAHVGVHLGPDRVLHLCREAGRPVVWTCADFAVRPRYARLLGAKRVVAGDGRTR